MNTFIQGNSGKSRHGATTENAKKYIDFASKNRIKGLLIEGWNTGWEQWINTENREGVFDFMTPYPDYNYEKFIECLSNKMEFKYNKSLLDIRELNEKCEKNITLNNGNVLVNEFELTNNQQFLANLLTIIHHIKVY